MTNVSKVYRSFSAWLLGLPAGVRPSPESPGERLLLGVGGATKKSIWGRLCRSS